MALYNALYAVESGRIDTAVDAALCEKARFREKMFPADAERLRAMFARVDSVTGN